MVPGAISFETLAEIAAGATARVDLCRLLPTEARAGALVAVKRLHPHIAEDPTFVRQFLDEVRITYWLRHPNVVEVAGWGTDQQGSYLAVELVQGVSLLRLMKTIVDTGEAFTERMVVYMAACICRGLGAAHSLRAPDGEILNLVHRDLTPGNVLVGFNGEVKITDFGMAKAKQRLTKTLTGMRKGEPTYMAPEQAKGDDIDARADLFSLGVMLFELFAGRRPWIARNDYEMLQLTDREPPADLRELRPKIDRELVSVVNRCLEPDRAARFQSAHEIVARLDEWLTLHGYQEDNAEALGRFVRRNAMRQMRWFERAIAGEMLPERMGRELPRVPTYTDHTPNPREAAAAVSAPGPAPTPAGPAPIPAVAVPRPSGRPASGGPPRPAADPRSIRAANAVQQLKKLAPAIEPPRGRARPRLPTLDGDGEATDVELKVGAIHAERRLPGVIIDDDEGNEEVPTLVKQGDAKMQAFRAEARQKQAARAAGAKPPFIASGILVDEESDGHITAVKKEEQRAAGTAIADPDSELPTAPRDLARIAPPAADEPEMPTPIAPQKTKSGPMRQVIPPTPDIPPRPFPTRSGMPVPSKPTRPVVPAPEPPVTSAPPAEKPGRITARPPPPPSREPPREAPPAPPEIAADPAHTSHDDVQAFDRRALQQQSPGDEEALVAEADRLAIEAVRRAEEARAAQLRAERKATAAKLAEQAAMIASEAVRMIRSAGLSAAIARLEEARTLEQHLQSGKFPVGEITAPLRLHPEPHPPVSRPQPPAPSSYPGPPLSFPATSGPAYLSAPPPGPVSSYPSAQSAPSPIYPPPVARPPPPPQMAPVTMGAAVAVLAVVALVVGGVLVALLSK